MLIDSNIIIYAAQSAHDQLRQFIVQNAPVVSAVSYVEVLGYHQLTDTDKIYFSEFFAATTVMAITRPILDQAIQLRQIKKMSLGDSLIAATCLVHNLKLVTHNIEDFSWVPRLALLNPFDS